MFPFLGILQHYAEFDACTIATLEKLLDARSFGGSINNITHCQTILLAFSSGFHLLFVF
jgi:hypothetical protein